MLIVSYAGLTFGQFVPNLALGAWLGGNGAIIGASANVVTVGLSVKGRLPDLLIMHQMRACWWPMMTTVTINMVSLLIAY